MYKNFKIVKVSSKYCDYLRKYIIRVSSKDLDPFVGVLFLVENCEYFALLFSPKEKHKRMKNTLDLIKIKMVNMG